jgi:hypothetical protein
MDKNIMIFNNVLSTVYLITGIIVTLLGGDGIIIIAISIGYSFCTIMNYGTI